MKKAAISLLFISVLVSSCFFCSYDAFAQTETDITEVDRLVLVVKAYENACNTKSTEKYREVLFLEDPRFIEIEDTTAQPLKAARVESILRWIDTHQNFEYQVEYTEIQAFLLSNTVGYVVAMNTWKSSSGEGKGRVTFIMVKTNDQWKIIHGHWSAAPKN